MKLLIKAIIVVGVVFSYLGLAISQTPTSPDVSGHYLTIDNGNGTFTITIQPNDTYGKDTSILDERREGNGGQWELLQWQMGGELTGSRRGRVSALLTKFDVSAIPADVEILSADAWLYKAQIRNLFGNCGAVIFQKNVYRLLTDWEEGSWIGNPECAPVNFPLCFDEANFNFPTSARTNFWNGTRAGIDFDPIALSTNTSSALGWVNWNVIDAVKGWVDGSFVNYGFVFRRPSYTFQCFFYEDRFYSSEFSNPSLRPKLEITYKLAVIDVALDIKPQSCPNPFNTKSKGVLPVAILGTADLNVNDINTLQCKTRRDSSPSLEH